MKIIKWNFHFIFYAFSLIAQSGCGLISAYYNTGPAPVVALSIGPNSSALTAPANVSLQAQATSLKSTVTKVEFYAGSAKIGEASVPPFKLDLPNLTGSYYDFSAVATDAYGQQTTSNVLHISLAGSFAKVAFTYNPPPSFNSFPINFFDLAGALPSDYLIDSGDAFGDRGNGNSYGWTNGTTPTSYYGNIGNVWTIIYPDRRYQTRFQMNSATPHWKMTVPNGDYLVRVLVGYENWQPGGNVTYGLDFDGTGTPVSFINMSVSNTAMIQRFWKSSTFTVTNSSIVLSQTAGNFFINAIEILPAGTDLQPPSVPTAVSATEIHGNSANIYWYPSIDNVNVDHYEIYKNGTLQGFSEGPKYLLANLTATTNYQIEVAAVDSAGNTSTKSAVYTLATAADDAVQSIRTSTPPTIDAVAAPGEWTGSPVSTTAVLSGACTILQANIQSKWDANKLYLFVSTTSDNVVSNNADLVEVYLDMNNSRSRNYQDGDYQFGFQPGALTSFDNNINGQGTVTFTTAASEYSTLIPGGSGVGKNWIFEAALAWRKISPGFIPSNGKQIGFEIHIKNNLQNCTAAYSERIIEQSWLSPQRFGTLILN